MIACGQHLINQQVSENGAPKAWNTVAKRPLTGFSHGAAGIAYALLRLYHTTQDENYLEAALEGIEYERSVFSEKHGNWPDFRSLEGRNSGFAVQWCHGAAGIALGRLGSLAMVDTPEIKHEIDIALPPKLNSKDYRRSIICAVGTVDQRRCCWSQPKALSSSVQFCVLLCNKPPISFREPNKQELINCLSTCPFVFNLGFNRLFQGTAGIGYLLLHLADDSLPCILLWD